MTPVDQAMYVRGRVLPDNDETHVEVWLVVRD